MNDFNVIPNTGKFGNIVNAINSNFQLAKEAIDVSSYQKTNCLGFYDTAAALNTAQPSPSDNDWALVGTNSNLTIYVAQNGSWTATSTTLSLVVDLTNYTLKSIYENGQAAQDQRIEDVENNTKVLSTLGDYTEVYDTLIRYTPVAERGKIITESAGAFKLRIYTDIVVGQSLKFKFSNNTGGSMAYAFYSTPNLSDMGVSTCLTTSTTDTTNRAITCNTAASNTYDVVVPENAVSLVFTLYDPASITPADVEVLVASNAIGEIVGNIERSLNSVTQQVATQTEEISELSSDVSELFEVVDVEQNPTDTQSNKYIHAAEGGYSAGDIATYGDGVYVLKIYSVSVGEQWKITNTQSATTGGLLYCTYSCDNKEDISGANRIAFGPRTPSGTTIQELTMPSNAKWLAVTFYTSATQTVQKAEKVSTVDILREELESSGGLTVSRVGDVVTAVYNNQKGYELIYTFNTIYPNSNQGYGLLYVRYRTAGTSSNGVILQKQTDSDMIGPILVDGVFCGGAHRITINAGTSEERKVGSIGNITKHFYANGVEILDGDIIKTDELIMVKTQSIYAPNPDTSVDLNILCEERETMMIEKDRISVSVSHNYEQTECVGRTIEKYYGMQTYGLGNVGDLKTMTLRGRYPMLQTIANSSTYHFNKVDYPNFNCFAQYRESDGWCVSAWVNPEVGMGDHSYVGDNDKVFVTGPSKLYHRLIADTQITSSLKYVWQGAYRFGHFENSNEIYNWIEKR